MPLLFIAMKTGQKNKVQGRYLIPYIISGMLLGFGWLTLFFGFKHTSVSSAVIIYNMAPVYVVILAPVILKERIKLHQKFVIFFSFIGLILIVGNNLMDGYGHMGILLSAVSGILYAVIVLINRSIKNRIDNKLATFIQVSVAMIVLLPFVILEGSIRDNKD